MSASKTTRRLLVIGACCGAVVGCASGTQFSDLRTTLQPPRSGYGRIFIYRTAIMGAAVQPSVMVNGEAVGSAVPRGFFYVDRPAGEYRISTSTEVTRILSLTLAPGQIRYVQLNIVPGFFVGHVYPALVEDSEARSDIADCHYIGT